MSLGRSVVISDDARLPGHIGPGAASVIVIVIQKDESGSQMALDSRVRVRTPLGGDLDLPPPFRTVALREVGDAFAHAVRIAAEEGAGTLVHVGRFDLAEFAVVLEPEEPLRTARRTLYAGLAALADALAVHAPPEKPINILWPDAVTVDMGLVGGARLAWPQDADEEVPPAWLVFGATIRTVAIGEQEPGLNPLAAALDDEGFVDVSSGRLVESFARHLMAVVDAWQQEGFAEVAKSYLSRLAPEKGVRHDIDDNGDLLVRRIGKTAVERRPLVPALAEPSWYDPVTRGPRR
jgi:biotin-(acetyl-CoA carboxylase) ligase